MERLKHWQLFLIFFAPLFIGLHVDEILYQELLQSISLSFIVIYLLAIGEYLHERKELTGHMFFKFNCCFLVVLFVSAPVVGDLLPENLVTIGIALVIYALLAIIQVIDHVALLIRMNENKEVDNYKQKFEFMLLFFWPIGIWILQPRINEIS